MTLYLKYRPQKIKDLDLENIRESLGKIIERGKIPHAFLFSGPKGLGKTSAARIIAKVVNCERSQERPAEPCNKCEQCLTITNGTNIDVIELDAASHRGIDDVRALREAVRLSPAKARKKVYIIDEAHMLTTEASNALLKTLEEPPDHVMFILATTNPEKLVETIRSRTTNLVFRKATPKEIIRSLRRVVKGEKLKAEKGALEAIAKAANGSFRDATKILEQLIAEGKKLEGKEVEEFLFSKREFQIQTLVELLVSRDVKAALEEVERVISEGISADSYLEAIIARLRSALLEKAGVGGEAIESLERYEIIKLIELFSTALSEIKDFPIEQLPLEMAIVRWCEGEFERKDHIQKEKQKGIDNQRGSESSQKSTLGSRRVDEGPNNPVLRNEEAVIKNGDVVIDSEAWSNILRNVKGVNASTEALLRAARPINFDGKILTLGVFYRFHKERLEDVHHRRVLEDVVKEVLGSPVRVVCTLTEAPVANKKVEVKEAGGTSENVVLAESSDDDIVRVAKEIFGN